MKSHTQKLLLVMFISIGLMITGMNMNLACGLVNNQTVYLDDDPNEPVPEPEIAVGCPGLIFLDEDPNGPEPEPEISVGCPGLIFLDDDPNEPQPEPEFK